MISFMVCWLFSFPIFVWIVFFSLLFCKILQLLLNSENFQMIPLDVSSFSFRHMYRYKINKHAKKWSMEWNNNFSRWHILALSDWVLHKFHLQVEAIKGLIGQGAGIHNKYSQLSFYLFVRNELWNSQLRYILFAGFFEFLNTSLNLL